MTASIRHVLAALLVAATALPGTAAAQAEPGYTATIGSLKVENVWARATRAKDAEVFLAIENDGAADRLIAASTPVARQVEIHGFAMIGSKPGSRLLGPIALPAGKELELEPKGVFLKLIGLDRRLAKGDEFELALTFENAGTGRVKVEVEAANATKSGHAGHNH
jgi:hypothetical protein